MSEEQQKEINFRINLRRILEEADFRYKSAVERLPIFRTHLEYMASRDTIEHTENLNKYGLFIEDILILLKQVQSRLDEEKVDELTALEKRVLKLEQDKGLDK